MEEKIIDVPGYEGYYQISESGKLYRVRPNMNCGVDIVKELPVKTNKRGLRLAFLSVNGKQEAIHLHCLLHDSFFPERTGMRFKFNGPMHINNIVLLETNRWRKKEEIVPLLLDFLSKNPSATFKEVKSFLKLGSERTRQLLESATGKRDV